MEILDGLTERKIFKINSNHSIEKMDIVAIEEPMEIAIKYIEKDHTSLKTISITMRTPGHDKYLVLGFLFSEGIIDSVSDIHDIQFKFSCTPEETIEQTVVVHIKPHLIHRVKDLNRHFYTSSSCGVCGKTTIDLAVTHCHFLLKSLERLISLDIIYKLPNILKSNQKLFDQTGGIHACALFDFGGNLITIAEDVGRHNAMDKLIGHCLENHLVPASEHILLVSGRASFELIQKALTIGVPALLAIGAPSSLAIDLASSFGMSLGGFLKDGSVNIYSGIQRFNL